MVEVVGASYRFLAALWAETVIAPAEGIEGAGYRLETKGGREATRASTAPTCTFPVATRVTRVA